MMFTIDQAAVEYVLQRGGVLTVELMRSGG